MATFDQRGQRVTYQYNAAGDINFGAVRNRADAVRELEKLKTEVTKAAEAQVIDAEVATDVEYRLTKAVQQAQKPDPDKPTLLTHLNEAKELVETAAGNVTAVSGLVTALAQAAATVQALF
jgi:hypothetical protein